MDHDPQQCRQLQHILPYNLRQHLDYQRRTQQAAIRNVPTTEPNPSLADPSFRRLDKPARLSPSPTPYRLPTEAFQRSGSL